MIDSFHDSNNETMATMVIRDGRTIPGLVLATALRRTLMHDVETIVFRYDHVHIENTTVTISKNTTPLHNEMISHRLSMLPLNIDPYDETDAILHMSSYTLNASDEPRKTVKTNDFRGETRDEGRALTQAELKEIFPLAIPIVKIRDGSESIQLRCTPVRSCGRLCGGHSPVSVCVARQLSESNRAELRIETIRGMHKMNPKKVLQYAFDHIIRILKRTSDALQNGDVPVEKAATSFTAYDFEFYDETSTFGILIQNAVAQVKGHEVSHISYMQPHPLDKVIVVRVSLLNSDENDLEKAQDVLLTSSEELVKELEENKNMLQSE